MLFSLSFYLHIEYTFQSKNQFIGQKDTLRFPVGEKIEVTGDSALTGSSIICSNDDIKQKAMYFTQFACNYPVSLTLEASKPK